jgi:iron complex transport system ATP-binding protein
MNVEIRGVTKRLGGVEVLRDVSATVESGTLVGLVGPNGAGKTTLLRTANATLSPDAGTVTVGGEDVHDLPSKAASRRVATVPQDTALSFEFSVREIVEMGRYPHRSRFGRPDDEEVVEAALERAQVADLADRAITEVSGGERQRVLLARALAQDAPVLLLDEPTASLDVHHQVRTLELVRDLVDEGRTAVAAIHDLTLAGRYCDELVVLADGEVLDTGPSADVLTGPALQVAFGEGAVAARHPVTGTPLVTARSRRDDRDASVHVVGGGGAAAPLLSRLDAAGFDCSVGVVGEGDADCETSRALGAEVVSVPALSGVTADARAAAADLARDADATVVADVALDAGQRPNLAVAAASDRVVLVEDRPVAARVRDDAARERYECLRERARVVGSDGVVAGVDAALAESPAPAEVDDAPDAPR